MSKFSEIAIKIFGRFWILDEPTTALDINNTQKL